MSETNVVRKLSFAGAPAAPRTYNVVVEALSRRLGHLKTRQEDATIETYAHHFIDVTDHRHVATGGGYRFVMAGAGLEFGPVEFAGGSREFVLAEQVQQLKTVQAVLSQEVAELQARVVALEAKIQEAPELRDLPDDQAKAEIKAYFEEHHGETLYASDVSAALSLDYDKVADWLQELENDGQISIPGPADVV